MHHEENHKKKVKKKVRKKKIKNNLMIKAVIKKNLTGKRSLDRPCQKYWEEWCKSSRFKSQLEEDSKRQKYEKFVLWKDFKSWKTKKKAKIKKSYAID